mmetsp:Transcript_10616/g.25206  ORF Transcript_10616/g.25206 Transcript_10616/m.25206 type:complete len:201 (-) Transcript_10616:676-1278(-)
MHIHPHEPCHHGGECDPHGGHADEDVDLPEVVARHVELQPQQILRRVDILLDEEDLGGEGVELERVCVQQQLHVLRVPLIGAEELVVGLRVLLQRRHVHERHVLLVLLHLLDGAFGALDVLHDGRHAPLQFPRFGQHLAADAAVLVHTLGDDLLVAEALLHALREVRDEREQDRLQHAQLERHLLAARLRAPVQPREQRL